MAGASAAAAPVDTPMHAAANATRSCKRFPSRALCTGDWTDHTRRPHETASIRLVPYMSSPHTCAVLLVDISGSTRLYEELGDEQALSRIDGCLRVLQHAASEFSGRIVKTTGDGLLCAFDEAE